MVRGITLENSNAIILYEIFFHIRQGGREKLVSHVQLYEDLISYYLEMIIQIGYSISGSRKAPQQIINVTEFILNKLQSL